ncbi:MAG: RodZ domain-containing protein [Ectothiorhodospira sp.]
MTTDERQDKPDTEYPVTMHASPGQLLREARESAGLSREALAERLHLHPTTMAALEEDRFGDLPEPPYVRGYLRGCARALEVEPAPLLEAFKACGQPAGPEEEQPPGPIPGRVESSARRRSGHPRALWVAVAGLILALVAGGWLLLAESSDGDAPVPARESSPEPSGRTSSPGFVDPRTEVRTSDAPEAPDAPDPLPEPAPVEGSRSTGEEAREAPDPEAGEEASPSPEAAVSDDEEGLHLVFTEDCWVRISDADGERLLSGLVRAGTEHRLEGAAPIRVFLGNAQGVEMTFNGKRVDTTARARDDRTARFTVGAP